MTVDRSSLAEKQTPEIKIEQSAGSGGRATTSEQRKLSFKEKFELEQLEKEMPQLQKERTLLEEKMNSGNISFDELQKAAERVSIIAQLLDEKEMRWLELSERI